MILSRPPEPPPSSPEPDDDQPRARSQVRDTGARGRPRRRQYLVFGSPAIDETDIAEVVATLRSGWIGTGPRTARFEQAFAEYLGVSHAVAVSSCTAALHLSLIASGVGPGDEVLVPAMTFVATANSVVHAGATPVLCDVDRQTQTVRPEDLEARRTPRTRAIIPVHFAGRPVDMTGIESFARAHDLTIISDAAHAIEAEHRSRKIASFGQVAAYSFYPTKNLTTGEGGLVATNDAALADRVRTWRLHGLSADAWKRFADDGFKHYESVVPGFKYNMTDLEAALGIRQLERLELMAERRREIWARYDTALADLPIGLPPALPAGDRHARHLYSVLLDLDAVKVSRDAIVAALHRENIGTGVHYRAVHLHPYYRDRFKISADALPNAAYLSERTLSLPLSARLSDEDVEDVIAAVRRVILDHRAP